MEQPAHGEGGHIARVVEAVRHNRAYCFTHPEAAAMTTERNRAMVADAL